MGLFGCRVAPRILFGMGCFAGSLGGCSGQLAPGEDSPDASRMAAEVDGAESTQVLSDAAPDDSLNLGSTHPEASAAPDVALRDAASAIDAGTETDSAAFEDVVDLDAGVDGDDLRDALEAADAAPMDDASSFPVPECDAYQRAFAACRGQPVNVPPTTAPTLAEHDRLQALCNVNLQRLAQACR